MFFLIKVESVFFSFSWIIVRLIKIVIKSVFNLFSKFSNKLNASFELFGIRGAIVGLALANNIEKTDEFKTAVDNAGGTAKRVADEQMNTLDGAILGLSSTWEKFVLGYKESENIFSKVIDSLSLAISTFSNKNIAAWRKTVEIMTLGIVPAASKIEKRLQSVSKSIAGASVRDLEYTIKKNKHVLENGSKTDKLVLQMLQDKLAAQKKVEDKAAEDKAKREEIAALNLELQQLAIKKEEEEEKTRLDKIESDKRIEQAQKESDAKRDILEDEVKEFLRLNENKRKTQSKLAKDILDKEKESTKELDEIPLTSAQKKAAEELEKQRLDRVTKKEQARATKEAAINAATELGNTLFDLKTAGLQREFEAAEGNAEKQAEISKKIAQQEKKKALFNIAINTATAIVKSLPNIPLSIIVGALGAIQAGVVASTPIPQFAKGTNYSPAGVALVGEKGRELIQSPSGEIMLANNPSLVNLQRGSKVFTNTTTEAILNDKNIVGELRLTRKAIQRMPRQRNESEFTSRQRGYNDGYRSLKHRMN